MATTNRTQTLIFHQFDGKTGSQQFFDAVRERAYIGSSYPPSTIDGTLSVDALDANISDTDIRENKRHYATLYVEMARSLTGRALITKRSVDIAEPKSGYLLLKALQAAAGINTQVTKQARLESFMDQKMPKSYSLLDWIAVHTMLVTELSTKHSTIIAEDILLTTLTRSLRLPDRRFDKYLTHIYHEKLTYEASLVYLSTTGELLAAHVPFANSTKDKYTMNDTTELIALRAEVATLRSRHKGNRDRPERKDKYKGSPCTNCAANPAYAKFANTHGTDQCGRPGGPKHVKRTSEHAHAATTDTPASGSSKSQTTIATAEEITDPTPQLPNKLDDIFGIALYSDIIYETDHSDTPTDSAECVPGTPLDAIFYHVNDTHENDFSVNIPAKPEYTPLKYIPVHEIPPSYTKTSDCFHNHSHNANTGFFQSPIVETFLFDKKYTAFHTTAYLPNLPDNYRHFHTQAIYNKIDDNYVVVDRLHDSVARACVDRIATFDQLGMRSPSPERNRHSYSPIRSRRRMREHSPSSSDVSLSRTGSPSRSLSPKGQPRHTSLTPDMKSPSAKKTTAKPATKPTSIAKPPLKVYELRVVKGPIDQQAGCGSAVAPRRSRRHLALCIW